jgi:hypothetical protein
MCDYSLHLVASRSTLPTWNDSSRQRAALRSGLLSTHRPVIPRSIRNALIWLITPKSKGKTKDQRLSRLDQK